MEMAAVGSTPDVNIVVQITRPPNYQGFYGEWGGTRRFVVTQSDGGLSSGDFQISPTRFSAFVNAAAPQMGWTTDQVNQITRGSSTTEEQAALQLTIPTIEAQQPLTPLQLEDVEDLGTDVNSGDGATLADFGTWAVQNYPADHYGLIMWDHGGGWSMIASDDTLAPAGIPMPDFANALDTITQAANQKLDFVGFDACLMAQLPVSLAVEPYADYQIGAEELVPGFGWDYIPPLTALVENPDLSVPDFAKAEIDGFNTLYGTTEKAAAASYDLGIIDLSKVDAVVSALSDFDSAVNTDTDLKAISTARSNVQQFGSLGELPDEANSISSVDLSDFMRLMSSLSSDDAVKQAAGNVIQAVSDSVLYHVASQSLPQAHGMSVFFPPDSNTFTTLADGDRYRSEFGTVLPEWQDFLDQLYGSAASGSGSLSLLVTDVSTTQAPGSIYDTPVITYNMNGKNVVGVTANILYKIDANTSVVLDTFPISSDVTTEDGSIVTDYPDGQSTNDFYWSPRIPTLSDGSDSLLVLMTTNSGDDQHGFIRGTYTNQVTGAQSDASLMINLDTYEFSGVWASSNGSQSSQTVAEVFPKPGDTFEPSYLILDASGNAQLVASGTVLTFSQTPFEVSDAPGPDGTYTVILQASDVAGTTAVDTATLDVQNSGLDPSLQGFKDLTFGLSFLYPSDWTDVSTYERADGTYELYMTDITGETILSAIDYTDVTSLDDMTGVMQDEISSIDGVQFSDITDVQVGDQDGTAMSYQYTDADGNEVDGIAVAVYVADTQQGYLLEIEAPSDQMDTAQQVMDDALNTSQFFEPVQ